VAKESSSLNLREKQTILNRISKPCKANLTHTLGTSNDCSKATVCLSFRLMDQIHRKGLQDHTHIQCAGRTSVARLHDRTPIHLCETYAYNVHDCRTYSHLLWNVLPHVGACAKNQITSGGRYVHSSGRLVIRRTAYHISRHVASTFKRLTTATTHCDLSQIYQHRQGIISTVILHINPVRHPYSDYRNVNITIPIKLASDRQSLDFYRSY
jgi:hypothetical protein